MGGDPAWAPLHLEGQVSLLLSSQLTSKAAALLWGPSQPAPSQLVLLILGLISGLGVKKSGLFFFPVCFIYSDFSKQCECSPYAGCMAEYSGSPKSRLLSHAESLAWRNPERGQPKQLRQPQPGLPGGKGRGWQSWTNQAKVPQGARAAWLSPNSKVLLILNF